MIEELVESTVLDDDSEVARLHLIMQLLQTVDAGLILLNEALEVQLWNSFMENHSGIRTSEARGKKLFSLFPALPQKWLNKKIESVFKLQSRSYSTWEQQPHLFDFKSIRPLTGKAEKMYQNVTLIPLLGINRKVSQVCILIYDVTDIAVNKLELQHANDALEKLSRTDRLTGLFNRGHWEERLGQEFRRSSRSGHISSLLMFDIDHFKKVNDTYGHQAGDAVICEVCDILRSTQRDTDIAGRYGGEEFAVVLPDTTAKQAFAFAERLRKKVDASVVKFEGLEIKFKISIGISQIDETMKGPEAWLSLSDQALYKSKNNGRNQTTVFEPETIED
ncbi:MAG: diguanylate cyclase [Pseudohongiellaceae bacterium]|nr:diguanylate cyclase [Pseudohongiellaceae bacterium]